MSINSCSINTFTINGLTCRRRFAGPVPPQPTTGGGHVQHYRYQNWYGRPNDEEDDIDYSKLEGFNIAVSITMNGQTFSQTVENNPAANNVVPMIAIQNLQIEPISPNIRLLNLKLRREPK